MEEFFRSDWVKYALINIAIVFGPIVIGWLSSVLNVQNTLSKRRFLGHIEAVVYNFVCVPIHELSHLLFSLIFMHKILDVKLFAVGDETGHVEYSFNKKSLYQKMGCYMSAVAPFLVSTVLLCVLYYICMPDFADIAAEAEQNGFVSAVLFCISGFEHKAIAAVLTIILSLSASSSKADRKNAMRYAVMPVILGYVLLMALHFAASTFFDKVIAAVFAIYAFIIAVTVVVYVFNVILIKLKIF